MMSNSCNSTKNKNVISKYFTKAGDESLEDFQESKKLVSGPKNTKSTTQKPRKTPKKLKKQKDIRHALKGKKNELIEFTKEFNSVCEKTGVDVDSEQLQLAVALSKSLQSEVVDINSQKSQNSQERNKKIRATLQEYGFVVPEIKITALRRIRKHRNQYKLISLSEAEKQQIISEKYSQVILGEVNCQNQTSASTNNSNLFHLSTNILYDDIKNNDVFYVHNLLEKSTSKFNLLRDWAEIPGRPVSPENFTNRKSICDFSAIEFPQTELDILLSGTLKSRDEIMVKKKGYVLSETKDGGEQLDINIDTNMTQRCYSPDIFEDESTLIDNSRNSKITSQDKDVYMDLTECVNHMTQVTKNLDSLSQRNVTKRKSDDFMDMTECVSSKSVVNKIDLTINTNNVIKDNYLELNLRKCNEINKSNVNNTIIIDVEEYSRKMNNTNHEMDVLLDLTQEASPIGKSQSFFDDFHHNHSDSKENAVEFSCHDLEADNQGEYCSQKHLDVKDVDANNLDDEKIDLTQSSNASDRNEDIGGEPKKDELTNTSKNNSSSELNEVTADNDIDLTQSSNSNGSQEISNQCYSALGKIDDISIDYDEINSIDKDTEKVLSQSAPNEIKEVDLSQNSEIFEIHDNELDYSLNKSRFDRFNKDTNRYDLDEIIEIKDIHSPDGNDKDDNIECNITQATPEKQRTIAINNKFPERNNKIDDISIDNGINRIHTVNVVPSESFPNGIPESSSYEVDDIIEIRDDHNPDKINAGNQSDIKEITAEKQHNSFGNESPVRQLVCKTTETNNDDYIINFDAVTPMRDYAAMSSPERNRELYKYGLKPLKRKRAIQLLTHIYNQTHPLIEELDDLPSTSKRRKTNHDTENNSLKIINGDNYEFNPEKGSSSMKINKQNSSIVNKSPLKNARNNNKEALSPLKRSKNSPKSNIQNVSPVKNVINGYEVTNEMPALKEVICHPDDWVFQKKEKTKIHTCRVPLHIAFHNYVSCRSGLRESILKYEPINIDVIHKDLAGYGHRYDPKDLLKFLDKRCITVKTTDNNTKCPRY